MNPESAYGRIGDATFVDVRESWEWNAGRIGGAVHIPLSDLVTRLDEIDPRRPLVVVCRTGARSAEAAGWLRGEGLDAHNLDGGVKAWVALGLPFEGEVV
jgi:rhodanese-related sulfurtransferase